MTKLEELRYWQEEIEKCKNIDYFFNNYYKVEGEKECTAEELLNKRRKHLRGETRMEYPIIPYELFLSNHKYRSFMKSVYSER